MMRYDLRPAVGGTGDLLVPRAQLTFLKSRLGEPGYRPKLEQAGVSHFVAEHD
ncbi:MAG TPA: hypothetical protein VNY75_00685 [Rhizomicrobium sp.]|jgi:hypothetical protein|nr:hypothetical protein [Rhizomicrobium sp.]